MGLRVFSPHFLQPTHCPFASPPLALLNMNFLHAGLVLQPIPPLHRSSFPRGPLFLPPLPTYVHLTSWVLLHLPLLVPTLTPFLVVSEDHVIIQAEFYLNPEESAEFMFDFDGDEIFHVDMQKKETVWRLPEFGRFASFEAQGALANMAVMKANLDIMIKRSNNTPNTNVPPEVTLLPNKPVELGEPNTLICFTDKFSPPVISVTWLRNGIPVTDGVSQTVFLPRDDHLFRKFHYLPFLPTTEDVYDCKVEHWGLNEPLLKHWEYEAPAPLPETTENAVCALGLIVALVGIIAGTIFIIKGVRKANTVEGRGPL